MTHIRTTPASDEAVAAADAPRWRRSAPARRPDGGRQGRRRVRRMTTLPAAGYTGRAYRARAEPMVVRPLRDGRYVVESEGGTYVVDAARATCTCPDSAIRGARCKHVWRVSAEIERRLVPAPDERERACAVCGGRAFVPMDQRGPALCDRHDREPGDLVRDRETGALLVVVERAGERADEARTREGRVVADYETNANYGDHEPVFAAAYVDRLPAGDGESVLAAVADRPRYLFPASRLAAVASGNERRSQGAESASGPSDRSSVLG